MFPLVGWPPYDAPAPAPDKAPCGMLGFAVTCGCGIPADERGGAENDEVGNVDTPDGCSFASCSSIISACASYSCSVHRLALAPSEKKRRGHTQLFVMGLKG